MTRTLYDRLVSGTGILRTIIKVVLLSKTCALTHVKSVRKSRHYVYFGYETKLKKKYVYPAQYRF